MFKKLFLGFYLANRVYIEHPYSSLVFLWLFDIFMGGPCVRGNSTSGRTSMCITQEVSWNQAASVDACECRAADRVAHPRVLCLQTRWRGYLFLSRLVFLSFWPPAPKILNFGFPIRKLCENSNLEPNSEVSMRKSRPRMRKLELQTVFL